MISSRTKQLQRLFNPRSIAIIGASPHPEKVGHIVMENIHSGGFTGEIFLINPNEQRIGEKICYPHYGALPAVPDLAVIAVPAAVALSLLPDIAKKGTKNIVIFSAGFKESGAAGEALEEKLAQLAQQYDLAVLGPNCLGFLNTQDHLNVTFGQAAMTPGTVRFISQSGAMATGLFDWASYTGVGFSEFITLGNKTVLSENDIFEYWQSEPAPSAANQRRDRAAGLSGYRPIGLYLESIDEGKTFLNLATKLSRRDPLFILKPGKSKAAQAAMHSHTGALAGDNAVLDAAMQQAGIIRCSGAEDLFDLAKGFAWERAPEGPRVAIVSNAGGPAVMSTDILAEQGLELAPLPLSLQKKIARILPAAANSHNPIDVLGDALADRYRRAIDLVLASSSVDALMVIVTPQIMTQIEATAEVIGQLSKKYKKPIVCSFMGGSLIAAGEKILNAYKIPSFRFPERALWTLGRMYWWRCWKKNYKKVSLRPVSISGSRAQTINGLLSPLQRSAQKILTPLQANQLAMEWGIPTPATQLVSSLSEAEQFARKQQFPVVLKVSSPQMLHKTEAHGVIVNISDETVLATAYKRLTALTKKMPGSGIQIQKQISDGLEIIVGVKRDPSFGNVLLFGAGGVLAELVQDTQLAIFPIDKRAIQNLIMHSKIGRLLQGFRAEKAYAVAALVDLIFKLTTFVEAVPLFKEIEINPVIVTHTNVYAVDVKAILL